MKLEALFKADNNKLIKLEDGKEVSLENLKIYTSENILSSPILENYFAVELPWSKIEITEENYNEEFLAALREVLKQAEEKNQFAFIIPVADKEITSELEQEAFTNTFNHTARRIKDCEAVIGFALPEIILSKGFDEFFMETLAKKHSHYLYFVEKNNLNKVNQNLQFGIILY